VAARKAASRPKGRGAAAASEVDFHGLKLPVPKKLPGTLAFDIAALDADGSGFSEVITLLESLVGEEGVAKVRAKIAEKSISLDKTAEELIKLVNEVIDTAGSSQGK
jgi:hypothetical protein